MAVVAAVILGTPLYFVFRRLGLQAWWQHALAGIIAAVPVWLLLAQPFAPVRWEQSGFYDTLNYLGTGVLAALVFHALSRRVLEAENAA